MLRISSACRALCAFSVHSFAVCRVTCWKFYQIIQIVPGNFSPAHMHFGVGMIVASWFHLLNCHHIINLFNNVECKQFAAFLFFSSFRFSIQTPSFRLQNTNTHRRIWLFARFRVQKIVHIFPTWKCRYNRPRVHNVEKKRTRRWLNQIIRTNNDNDIHIIYL